jgi:hypothetical protein
MKTNEKIIRIEKSIILIIYNIYTVNKILDTKPRRVTLQEQLLYEFSLNNFVPLDILNRRIYDDTR